MGAARAVAAIGLAAAVMATALGARAEPPPSNPRVIDVLDTPAELRLDAAWLDAPLAPGTVDAPAGVWRHRSGATLIVSRTPGANGDAWRKKSRDAFCDEVEAGVRAASPSYRRRERAVREIGGVPALDLSFRRTVAGHAEVVVMRFLFFRTHTATAAAAIPDRRWNAARGAVTQAMQSFAPAPDWTP